MGRLYLGVGVLVGVAGVDFTLAYGVIAWACRVPNLLVAQRLLRATSPPPPASQRTA